MTEIVDGVLADPQGYREKALKQTFSTVHGFHGIAEPPDTSFLEWFKKRYPQHEPTLTFLRKSPVGQQEPNFIHTDTDMGDVTAILYLNPEPPAEDGTSFWERADGAIEGGILVGEEGKDLSKWSLRGTVPAAFNRALIFSAPLFHSRAIEANYGKGNEARLIQVLFARRK